MKSEVITLASQAALEQFCLRWKITELALFGSVLRDDFGPNSDIDLLFTLSNHAHWTLLDLAQMENELTQILGRTVDLVSRSAIEQSPNWLRRERILTSAQPFVTMSEQSIAHAQS